jgi:urease accessory protein
LELYPTSGLHTYLDWIKKDECYGNASIVHGWVCAYVKQSVEQAVMSHLYASINSLVQNALRAMAMGQTQGQKVLTALLPLVEQEAMAIVRNPLAPNELASYTLLQEIGAMRHESLYSRLFMS